MRDTYNGAMHLLILYMIEPYPIPYVLLCDVMSFVFYFCVFLLFCIVRQKTGIIVGIK